VSRPGKKIHENSAPPALDEDAHQNMAAAAEGAEDVLFGFESWRISEEVIRGLMQVAEWMKTNPNKRLVIEGHADERGTSTYNLVLGEKRARAIQSVLINLGIDANRLAIVSYGKERPLCRELHEGCYQRNRRGHMEASMP
jgi:peptidoglycan-associated lipoprotein